MDREITSRAQPAVVSTDKVRYDRVMMGICLYQSSTSCAMLDTFMIYSVLSCKIQPPTSHSTSYKPPSPKKPVPTIQITLPLHLHNRPPTQTFRSQLHTILYKTDRKKESSPPHSHYKWEQKNSFQCTWSSSLPPESHTKFSTLPTPETTNPPQSRPETPPHDLHHNHHPFKPKSSTPQTLTLKKTTQMAKPRPSPQQFQNSNNLHCFLQNL